MIHEVSLQKLIDRGLENYVGDLSTEWIDTAALRQRLEGMISDVERSEQDMTAAGTAVGMIAKSFGGKAPAWDIAKRLVCECGGSKSELLWKGVEESLRECYAYSQEVDMLEVYYTDLCIEAWEDDHMSKANRKGDEYWGDSLEKLATYTAQLEARAIAQGF